MTSSRSSGRKETERLAKIKWAEFEVAAIDGGRGVIRQCVKAELTTLFKSQSFRGL